MKKAVKSLLVVILAVCMAFTAVGCHAPTWVYEYDDVQISSGVYLAVLLSSYSTAASKVSSGTALLKQEIDGMSAADWIVKDAKEALARYVGIERKFDELGLTLSELDLAEIEQSVQSTWAQIGSVYEENAVGQESYRKLVTNTKKGNMIFEKYYGTGGLEAVPNSQLFEHFKDNYAVVNTLALSIASATANLTDEQKAKNEEIKKLAESYVEEYNKGKKTINELYDAYQHYLNDSEHDSSDAADKIGKDEDTRWLLHKDEKYPTEAVATVIFNDMKPNNKVAKLVSDTSAYYVVVRYEISQDDEDFEEAKLSILSDIKGDEFNEMIDEWAADVEDPTVNGNSLSVYKPSKIKL